MSIGIPHLLPRFRGCRGGGFRFHAFLPLGRPSKSTLLLWLHFSSTALTSPIQRSRRLLRIIACSSHIADGTRHRSIGSWSIVVSWIAACLILSVVVVACRPLQLMASSSVRIFTLKIASSSSSMKVCAICWLTKGVRQSGSTLLLLVCGHSPVRSSTVNVTHVPGGVSPPSLYNRRLERFLQFPIDHTSFWIRQLPSLFGAVVPRGLLAVSGRHPRNFVLRFQVPKLLLRNCPPSVLPTSHFHLIQEVGELRLRSFPEEIRHVLEQIVNLVFHVIAIEAVKCHFA